MESKDTLDIGIGCSGLKIKHYQSGMVLYIKDAELLDLLKHPEIEDYFKKYQHIADDFR